MSRKKTPKCFPAWPLFLVFLMKYLSKCPSSKTIPPPHSPALKNFWLCNWTQASLLLQNVWQYSEYVCLNNCLVICTATLCCVALDTFKIMAYSPLSFSGICGHILSHSALLKHIYAYSDIIKAYPGLFRHIECPCIFRTLPYLES